MTSLRKVSRAQEIVQESFRFPKCGVLFAVPRMKSCGGSLNMPWPCHGLKGFQLRKRSPLYQVARFRWESGPTLYFKIAALPVAAAMGVGAHVQSLFPTHGLVSSPHFATSGIISCRPRTIFCSTPIMVCLILSGFECLVKLSLMLSSPLIFRTLIFPFATWSCSHS